MEYVRHKTRYVAEGHITNTSATTAYVNFSRETVRIAPMISALNDLKVQLGDIINVYVQASVTEKVWTTLCPEF